MKSTAHLEAQNSCQISIEEALMNQVKMGLYNKRPCPWVCLAPRGHLAPLARDSLTKALGQ